MGKEIDGTPGQQGAVDGHWDTKAVAAELATVPEAEAVATLSRAAREMGAGAVAFLEALAADGTPGVAGAAVKALGSLREVAAASALERLGVLLPAAAGKAARRELHRLATLGVVPATVALSRRPSPERPANSGPVYQALASAVDGNGSRAVWFAFQEGLELDVLALVLDDRLGIKETSIREGTDRRKFERQVLTMIADEEMPWIDLPVDYARHLVEEAHSLNAVTGTPLPLEFLAWRRRLGPTEAAYELPIVYSVINAAEVRWDPRNLDSSGSLYQMKMFGTWALEGSELRDFVRERALAKQSGIVLPGSGRGDTPERLGVDRAVLGLFGPERRGVLKRRLEEMAYVLWRREKSYPARLALAAAMALEPPDRPLQNHPFVRAMVEYSLEIAEEQSRGDRTRAVKPGVQLVLPY